MAANNEFDSRQPTQSTNDAFRVPRVVYLVNTTLLVRALNTQDESVNGIDFSCHLDPSITAQL